MKLDLAWVITMPQMPFPNILAFVEGEMEQLFLNDNFTYVEVVTVPNGKCWTVDALCSKIGSFYRARDPYNVTVVVWLDREKRPESAEFMKQRIRNELLCCGADPNRLAILINDIMSENIILADEEFIKKEFNKPDYKYVFEGKGGKAVIKSLYKEFGQSYSETFHGSAALKKIRLSRSAINSPPVSSFVGELNLPCWWIL